MNFSHTELIRRTAIANIVLPLLAATLLMACAGGGSGGDQPAPDKTFFPTAADDFDKGGDINRDPANASAIVVGRTYKGTIFPQGDLDWMKVSLKAGTAYEVVVDHQCPTCGTETRLFGMDAATEVGERNNYYDSTNRIKFTPATSGTYFLRITYQTLDNRQDSGVSNYWVNVHKFVDADGDGVSSWFDCDDKNSSINIWGNDIAGDGVDQDCSGADALVVSEPDRFEPDDNSPATTTSTLPLGGYLTYQMFNVLRLIPEDRFGHTFTAGDVDWYKVTVPAGHHYFITAAAADGFWDYSVYQMDGVTPASLENNDSHDQTFMVKIFSAGAHFYIPYLVDFGTDADGDGYTSQNQDIARDCDDGNPGIHPYATEIPGNGIDENCSYSSTD